MSETIETRTDGDDTDDNDPHDVLGGIARVNVAAKNAIAAVHRVLKLAEALPGRPQDNR